MLAGTRNCDEVHDLYASGNPRVIANSFYFNSWMGGELGSADRLLTLLAEIDVGKAADPRLDRALDFHSPRQLSGLLGFESRGRYDLEILTRLYEDLPWNHSVPPVVSDSTRTSRTSRWLSESISLSEKMILGDGCFPIALLRACSKCSR